MDSQFGCSLGCIPLPPDEIGVPLGRDIEEELWEDVAVEKFNQDKTGVEEGEGMKN